MVEHLGERLVRDTGVGARRPHQDRHLMVVQGTRRLSDQPGLARAGLTSHEDQLTTTSHDL
jgi:hypothetical protein